nr:head-tail adaptor [Pantoea cypripedii]
MPDLDVSDVLLDPDFADDSLVCHRQIQTVDEDNFPTNTSQDIPFVGVVTVDRSLEAKRMAVGQNINGAILIITQFRLTQGQAPSGDSPRLDADIVTYNGRNYRVTFVDPYTSYGAGFVQAHCELVDFDGGTPVEQ